MSRKINFVYAAGGGAPASSPGRKKKPEDSFTPAAVGASAGIAGAALLGGTTALRRGSSLGKIAGATAKGGLLAGAMGATSAATGSNVQ